MAKLSELAEGKFGDEKGFEVDFSGLVSKLPSYLDLERIEVDLDSILKICRITRTDSLTVLGFNEKEKDDFDISGMDAEGGATGTVNSTRPTDKMNIGSQNRFLQGVSWQPTLARSHDFRRANIFMNLDKVKDLQDLRDPEAWAKLLDSFLKEQLSKMAKERLGFDFQKFSVELSLPILVLPLAMLVAIIKRSIPSALFAAGMASFISILIEKGGLFSPYPAMLFMIKMMFVFDDDHALPKGIRSSPANPLTLGDYEYDRLILVWHMLRTKTLVSSAMAEVPNISDTSEDLE